MAKTRLPYAAEFRRQMVELVRAGRTPEELATEFEPTAQSIRNWVAQSNRNAGRGDGAAGSLIAAAAGARHLRSGRVFERAA